MWKKKYIQQSNPDFRSRYHALKELILHSGDCTISDKTKFHSLLWNPDYITSAVKLRQGQSSLHVCAECIWDNPIWCRWKFNGLERLVCRLQILPSKHAFGELGLRAPGRIHHLQPHLGLGGGGGGRVPWKDGDCKGNAPKCTCQKIGKFGQTAPIKS
jgi:hypothetical protein